ncbi:MAG: PilZ domain-containing protein [Cellvibrionaceae bacterium]
MTEKENTNELKNGQQSDHVQDSSLNRESDRRVFSRVEFASKAKVIQANKVIPVEIIDISLKGVLITEAFHQNAHAFRIDMQSPLQLMIPLSENTLIDMEIEAVHKNQISGASTKPNKQDNLEKHTTDQYIIGCRCVSIDHASLTHLRRLIELNSSSLNTSDNPENRELAALFRDQTRYDL